MQIRVFSIPMDGELQALEEMNDFLRSQKVLSVEKVAVVDHGRHYWSICVEYLPRRAGEASGTPYGSVSASSRPRLDYREILAKEDFDRYTRLRSLRKQLADAEAVPVYTILTNAQLADIARSVPQTKAELGRIEGVGPAKLDRYAEPLRRFKGTGRCWPCSRTSSIRTRPRQARDCRSAA